MPSLLTLFFLHLDEQIFLKLYSFVEAIFKNLILDTARADLFLLVLLVILLVVSVVFWIYYRANYMVLVTTNIC